MNPGSYFRISLRTLVESLERCQVFVRMLYGGTKEVGATGPRAGNRNGSCFFWQRHLDWQKSGHAFMRRPSWCMFLPHCIACALFCESQRPSAGAAASSAGRAVRPRRSAHETYKFHIDLHDYHESLAAGSDLVLRPEDARVPIDESAVQEHEDIDRCFCRWIDILPCAWNLPAWWQSDFESRTTFD